jgi:hypothetical protein
VGWCSRSFNSSAGGLALFGANSRARVEASGTLRDPWPIDLRGNH